MAQRRMFSKNIIEKASFLRMPLTTQALYFHLGIHADDDGIVEAFKVLRMINGNEDDLRVLANKDLVKILNEDLVTFITDWGEHNLLRADRKTDSIYQHLLVQIIPDIKLKKPTERAENRQPRQEAMRNSELPYSFNYKIKKYFLGENCPVCYKIMDGASKQKPTIQHNIPISNGGKHELENISIICHKCNVTIRGKSTPAYNNAKVREIWEKIQSGVDLFGQPNDRPMTENDGIGKDRLGEDRIGKNNNNNATKLTKQQSKEDIDTAQLLLDEIRNNLPEYKAPNSLNGWADEVRKMIEIDRRTRDQIEFVIKWTQQDTFWQSNILSMKAVRKQFDRLVAQAKRENVNQITFVGF